MELTVPLYPGAALLIRTDRAVVTLIVCDLTLESVLVFPFAYIFRPQFLPCLTDVFVFRLVIRHVLTQSHIALVLFTCH